MLCAAAHNTYVATGEGWLYVAFVLDVFSRMIVGWQIAGHMHTDLVLDALEMASWRRDRTTGPLVHHSDAGSQYTSIRYTQRLAEAGIQPSIGSIGDSYDCEDPGGGRPTHMRGFPSLLALAV